MAAAMSNPVFCPICTRGTLLQNVAVVFCSTCGFRLDTQTDATGLEWVRQQLEFYAAKHGARCAAVPRFSVLEDVGLKALTIHCEQCGLYEFVL